MVTYSFHLYSHSSHHFIQSDKITMYYLQKVQKGTAWTGKENPCVVAAQDNLGIVSPWDSAAI